EVDVDRAEPARMGLDLADQHLLRFAVDDEGDQMGAPPLYEDLLGLQPVQRQRRRLGLAAVDDGRKLALAVQAPGTLADQLAGGGSQLQSINPLPGRACAP